jgi:hypothetical protein
LVVLNPLLQCGHRFRRQKDFGPSGLFIVDLESNKSTISETKTSLLFEAPGGVRGNFPPNAAP